MIARRPASPRRCRALLADARTAPIVLLEAARDLGNVGACVRVAAAADVAGVLATGVHDPWDPAALRGERRLALRAARRRVGEESLRTGCPTDLLVAIDPEGEELRPGQLPARAILAFGGERQGLSEELLGRADARVRLPMRDGRLEPQPRHVGGRVALRLAAPEGALRLLTRRGGGRPLGAPPTPTADGEHGRDEHRGGVPVVEAREHGHA